MGSSVYEPRFRIRDSSAREGVENGPCEVVSHEILFATEEERCHACDGELPADDSAGYGLTGRGLLIFYRGEERRAEEPKLCPACGAAVGMTMLTRWAIEEEEG